MRAASVTELQCSNAAVEVFASVVCPLGGATAVRPLCSIAVRDESRNDDIRVDTLSVSSSLAESTKCDEKRADDDSV